MRSSVRSRPAVAITVLFVAATVAGCSQTEVGVAAPESGNLAPTAPSESQSATGDKAPPVEPCSLLDPTELSEYGEFEGPEESTLSGDPVCAWRVPLDSASDVEAPSIRMTFLARWGLMT